LRIEWRNWVYYRTVPGALDDLRDVLGEADAGKRVVAPLVDCSDDCSCK
jgi:hypothetical protein